VTGRMPISGGGGILTVAGGDTATGLVCYWPFNDGSGTTATELHGLLATFNTVPTWGTGFVTLDGANNTRVNDDPVFSFGSTMTAFGWVRGAAQNGFTIFSQYDGGTTNRAWRVDSSNAGSFNTMRVIISFDGNNVNIKDYYGSQQLLGDGNWHSFAFRFNSGVLDLFVDGVKDPSVTKNVDMPFSTIFDSTVDLTHFCLLVSNSIALQYTGDAQRFRLYNTAKTDVDIAAIHALGHA